MAKTMKDVEKLLSFHGVCPLCNDVEWNEPFWKRELASAINEHCTTTHSFELTDLHAILDVGAYLAFWKSKFRSHDFKRFCVARDEIFVLDPSKSTEDAKLRCRINESCLSEALTQKEVELSDDTFSTRCLFCEEPFVGIKRAKFIHHLAKEHSFRMGGPDNLVYVDELLVLLADCLAQLRCYYCEGVFKTRAMLKEHCRKKKHKRVRANNQRYDRFYLINYLEPGRTWQEIQADEDDGDEDVEEEAKPKQLVKKLDHDDDSDIDDGDDDHNDDDHEGSTSPSIWPPTCCLFCSDLMTSLDELLAHCNQTHGVDLAGDLQSLQNGFYDQLRLINLTRRYVVNQQCPFCEAGPLGLSLGQTLTSHIALAQENFRNPSENNTETNPHTSLLDSVGLDKLREDPNLYFSTIPDDSLLFMLQDNDRTSDSDRPLPRYDTKFQLSNASRKGDSLVSLFDQALRGEAVYSCVKASTDGTDVPVFADRPYVPAPGRAETVFRALKEDLP